MDSPDLFWVAHNPAAPPGVDYVAFHQARVCVLALRLGADLGYDRARLRPLGLAAALFDAGLWQMPPQLIERADALSGQGLATYRSHPRLSAGIVERWSPPDARVVPSILDHHEREQGQGFPRGLHGGGIDPDAKIIGLVDTYTALTVPPSSRPRQRPHEAIRDIVKTRNDQFSSPLIKVLLSEISVFPPGTIVRLNTEEVGRVIAVNRHHPLRPRVEVVTDAKGQRLAVPKVIDLSEAPFLYITGPVGEGR
jgi:HD-GYP domain-containing protein (c-di-GMP phosphodiesterase class II)